MYIKINKPLGKYGRTLQFSVIESFRDGGKVRHRTLFYLASIKENALYHFYKLGDFWKDCDMKLENLPEAERTRLAARIETIVPRPTEEIRERENQRLLQQRKDFAAYMLSRHTNTNLT